MATRLLLTLLALLAGLAAQFTPAQARGGAPVDVEIGATANVGSGQIQAASRTARHDTLQLREWHVGAAQRPIAAWPVIAVPTVLQGIDRARE